LPETARAFLLADSRFKLDNGQQLPAAPAPFQRAAPENCVKMHGKRARGLADEASA